MKKQNIGFLQRSQEFRKNAEDGKYFPILDCLYKIRHQNDLPASFHLRNLYGFSDEDVEVVLSTLYPERIYACKRIKNDIFCAEQ